VPKFPPTEVASIPSGLIAIWHGLIANIPSGWVICDGNNSTPNLLAKFVEGVATAATNPGATGGATSKTTSGHTHELNRGTEYASRAMSHMVGPWNSTSPVPDNGDMYDSEGAGSGYLHQVKSGTNSRTDSISDIRPSYYDVAFIMKT